MYDLLETIKKVSDMKKISMSSFQVNRIRGIERDVNKGRIPKDKKVIMERIKKEFGYHLSREDYEKIERDLRI